jgi:hypothetical protein
MQVVFSGPIVFYLWLLVQKFLALQLAGSVKYKPRVAQASI